MTALQRLKERKLVQWTLAYLAGAWLALEVFSTLREELGWSSGLFPVLLAVLAVGLIVTLVLAWYHGEQGRQRVSGPELLIIGGILLVAALVIPLLFGPEQPGAAQEAAADADSTRDPPPASERSIAVLPFDNVSGRAEDAPLVDGLHGEVLNQLYKIRSLEHRSQRSVLAYRDSDKSLPTIGDELGVRFLVEADVQRVGAMIRMNVQLFDAPSDRVVWQDAYNEGLTVENMLDLQRRIAIGIATQAGAEILDDQAAQLSVEAPDDWAAYERYLDGLSHFRESVQTVDGTERLEAFRQASEALQEAIALEAEWAPAWAALGRVYHFMAGYELDPSVNFPRSREALDRALELDSLHAPAWASLGFVLHNWERDFESAEAAYRTAQRLGWPRPSGYAVLLLSWGRYAEAIAAYERAASFDPTPTTMGQRAWAHICAGDYDTAIEQVEQRNERFGNSAQTSSYLGYAYLKAGYREEGLAEIARMEGLDAGKALVYALSDSTERAEEHLAAVEQAPPNWVMSGLTVAATLVLGGPDRALDYLERAVERDPRGLLQVQCLEEVRSLEGDPRYESVLDRVGFPPR